MTLKQAAILPKGFCAAGVASGIKKSGKPDLALFFSSAPCAAAGLFTTNKVVAAPVLLCKKHLSTGGGFRAVIANSGNANCFTGAKGANTAAGMARSAARHLGVDENSVFVASTGIIGKQLPLKPIERFMPVLVRNLSPAGIREAARAIMTTDKFVKAMTVRADIGGGKVTVCGVAKGAGMIAPNMATMLSFVFTDARVSPAILAKVLRSSVGVSYNCVTVDGCMSTNDTVICMANGCAGNRMVSGGKDLKDFQAALDAVNLGLAKMMVRDGEGATKMIEVRVTGARSREDARKAGLAIANSNLFKTAVYGENPNFGRIAAAVGASGCFMAEEKLKVRFGALNKKEVRVEASLNVGKASCVIYTSDLTPEYIKINAEYN